MLVLSGCSSDDAGTSRELNLRHTGSIRIVDDVIPVDADFVANDQIAYWDSEGRVVLVDTSGAMKLRWQLGDSLKPLGAHVDHERLQVLASRNGQLLLATQDTATLLTNREHTGAVIGGRRLGKRWVIVWVQDGKTIIESIHDNRVSEKSALDHAIPDSSFGRGRLVIAGDSSRVLIASQDSSIRASCVGADRVVSHLKIDSDEVIAVDSGRSVLREEYRLVAATSVGSTYILTLSDLRSEKRKILIVSSDCRLERGRTLHQPIVFVASSVGYPLLAAYRAIRERELILFSWQWGATRQGKETIRQE